MEAFARAIASGVGLSAGTSTLPGRQNWIDDVVRDLQRHKGSSLVIAGEQQPPIVHILAHSINQTLGNIGTTVTFSDPIEANQVDQMASLIELARDLEAGAVEAL